MQFNTNVQTALRHINDRFPEVSQVFFGADGRWMFCSDDFVAPKFENAPVKVDISLLEKAADAADNDQGFPCAYRLLNLADYYGCWDRFGLIPISEGNDEVEADTIMAPFLHFPVGTPREEIWHWFEAQNPDFVVGEVLQGIRK